MTTARPIIETTSSRPGSWLALLLRAEVLLQGLARQIERDVQVAVVAVERLLDAVGHGIAEDQLERLRDRRPDLREPAQRRLEVAQVGDHVIRRCVLDAYGDVTEVLQRAQHAYELLP